MGDIIGKLYIPAKITTHFRQPTSFYRVTSGAISFEVKSHSAAVIGLAKEPGKTCQYWCGYVQGGRIWMKGPQGIKYGNCINHSISPNIYKRFWLSWNCGKLRVGQSKETSHIVSYPNIDVDLKYVVFTSHDVRFPATWKIELPPAALYNVRNNVPCKNIQGGELRWLPAEDQLPDDTVIGGCEGECVYICRAKHRGSLTPGKFVPSEGVAYVPWGGNANVPSEFEILCGYNFTWMPTSEDNIPINAFVAGHAERTHEKLYIGRVNHMNCLVPGKVQPSHQVCYIPYLDKELSFNEYEILAVPSLDPYSAGLYFEVDVESDPVEDHGRYPVPLHEDNFDDEEDDDYIAMDDNSADEDND